MEKLNEREIKLVRESFANSLTHIFDNNNSAREVVALLEKAGVAHAVGDFLHEVNGRRQYNLGIVIKDTKALNELLSFKFVESEKKADTNPVKDMERVAENASKTTAGKAPMTRQEEVKGQGVVNKPAQEATSATKKARNRKKVEL